MKYSRRRLLKIAGATATAAGSGTDAIPAPLKPTAPPHQPTTSPIGWARGKEGQRKADLGNGTFLNPIMTVHHSVDGESWTKYGVQFEVSGYHQNVAGDFLSLRPAIYAAGAGEVRVRNVHYTAL
jgi:hypothetical protein